MITRQDIVRRATFVATLICFFFFGRPTTVGAASVAPGCGATAYYQDDSSGDGLAVMEAEASTRSLASQVPTHDANALWLEYTSNDAGNGGYVRVNSTNQNALTLPPAGARLDFDITFVKTGIHHFYIRYFADDGSDNSIHAAFDGTVFQANWNVPTNVTGWTWIEAPLTFTVPTTGVHTLTIFHREDGFDLDRLAISTTTNYPFTGIGPDATEDGTSLTRGMNERVEHHMDYRTGEGYAVIEAEDFTYNMSGLRDYECQPWIIRSDPTASGGQYMATENNGVEVPNGSIWSAPMLDFEITVAQADYYYVFIRHKASNGNNTIFTALDYSGTYQYARGLTNSTGWRWNGYYLGYTNKTSGTFLLSLVMRSDGAPIDKIVVTTDPYFNPTGTGPIPTTMFPARLVYQQDNTPDHLVQLPMETPSRRLPGIGLFNQLGWEVKTDPTALGGMYAQVEDPGLVNNLLNGALSYNAPVEEFDINFVQTGIHYLNVRHRAPTGSDNSYTYLFNDVKLGEQQFNVLSPGSWTFYEDLPTINVPSTGIHKLTFAMREDGTPIDHITISSNPAYNAAALPVELLLVTGEALRDYNLISWSTAFEHETAYHHVERSTTGLGDWEIICSLPAAGNSDDILDYEFYDRYPEDLSYYRIVTEDLDGSSTISSVLAVTRALQESPHLNIYPNPASDLAKLSIDLDVEKDVTLRLVTMGGQVVAEREYRGHVGQNTLDLPVDHLPAGSYVVSAFTPGKNLMLSPLYVVR